jgi:hypothetical protein
MAANQDLINVEEVSAILLSIKHHQKDNNGRGLKLTRASNLFVGYSAFNTLVFVLVLFWVFSVVAGFYSSSSKIIQMGRFIAVAVSLTFVLIMVLSSLINICRTFFKHDNGFLDREYNCRHVWLDFANSLTKYKTSSLNFVADMLVHDIENESLKENILFGSKYNKSGVFINAIIFIFVLYGIWNTTGDWGWCMWGAFFLASIYTVISFVFPVNVDVINEIKKYAFLLKQAAYLQEKNNFIRRL